MSLTLLFQKYMLISNAFYEEQNKVKQKVIKLLQIQYISLAELS